MMEKTILQKGKEQDGVVVRRKISDAHAGTDVLRGGQRCACRGPERQHDQAAKILAILVKDQGALILVPVQ